MFQTWLQTGNSQPPALAHKKLGFEKQRRRRCGDGVRNHKYRIPDLVPGAETTDDVGWFLRPGGEFLRNQPTSSVDSAPGTKSWILYIWVRTPSPQRLRRCFSNPSFLCASAGGWLLPVCSHV